MLVAFHLSSCGEVKVTMCKCGVEIVPIYLFLIIVIQQSGVPGSRVANYCSSYSILPNSGFMITAT